MFSCTFYRAVTMFITVLPKPDESYVCAAKMEDITPYGKHNWVTHSRHDLLKLPKETI